MNSKRCTMNIGCSQGLKKNTCPSESNFFHCGIWEACMNTDGFIGCTMNIECTQGQAGILY